MSSIESQQSPAASPTHGTGGGYLELITDDNYVDRYVGPSAENCGNLVPTDEKPAPVYIVPLPSPTLPHGDDDRQEATIIHANPDAPKSPDATSGYMMPSEGDADGGRYVNLSVRNSAPDADTILQLQDGNRGSSNTDSVRVSSQ